MSDLAAGSFWRFCWQLALGLAMRLKSRRCRVLLKAIPGVGVGSRGQYEGPRAADSMKKLAETGAEWVCIAFGANMKDVRHPGDRLG